jgi:hypothetical protein
MAAKVKPLSTSAEVSTPPASSIPADVSERIENMKADWEWLQQLEPLPAAPDVVRGLRQTLEMLSALSDRIDALAGLTDEFYPGVGEQQRAALELN